MSETNRQKNEVPLPEDGQGAQVSTPAKDEGSKATHEHSASPANPPSESKFADSSDAPSSGKKLKPEDLPTPLEPTDFESAHSSSTSFGWGKVLAVLIVILVALAAAAWVFAGNTLHETYLQPAAADLDGQSVEDRERTADHQALEQETTRLLDRMKDQNEAFVSRISRMLDEGFYDTTGYRHADLGVNPEDVSRWMLENFDYRILDITPGNDTGTVSVSIQYRDATALVSAFYDRAYDFFNSPDALGMDETAARARMGEIYLDAMGETDAMASLSTTLTFEREEGAWTVDEESFERIVEELFDVYAASSSTPSSSSSTTEESSSR